MVGFDEKRHVSTLVAILVEISLGGILFAITADHITQCVFPFLGLGFLQLETVEGSYEH